FGDLGLLGRDHIHDHAALQHLGQSPLDPEGALLRHTTSVYERRCRSLGRFRRGPGHRGISKHGQMPDEPPEPQRALPASVYWRRRAVLGGGLALAGYSALRALGLTDGKSPRRAVPTTTTTSTTGTTTPRRTLTT